MKRIALCTLCLFRSAYAATPEPLSQRDLNPFLAGFELPAALPSAETKSRHSQLDVQFSAANISLDEHSSGEHLVADAEIHRWQFTLNHAFNDRFSMIAELPYQSIGGGMLDSFIEDFHRALGLPNGNRATWPRDRLLVSYTSQGQTLFQLDRNVGGFGDLSLRGGWHIDRNEQHAASLWLSAKLPTGNADKLSGSDSTDLALSLSASQILSARFNIYQQLSLNYLGIGERMPVLQKRFVYSGTVGIGWQYSRNLSVLAQLDAHSRVFNSDLRLLGPALQLSFGPRYQTQHWQTTLGITEDIAVDTSPDVQFQLSLRYLFN